MARQISLDAWQAKHLAGLLRRGAAAAGQAGRPIVLYRQALEEEDGSYEELVCTLTAGYVVEQVVTSGGPVPPTIGEQLVFPVSEYPERLLLKSRDRFKEVVARLEEELG